MFLKRERCIFRLDRDSGQMTLTGPGKNSFPVMADIIDEIDREHPSEAEVGAVIRAGSAYAVREPSRIVIERSVTPMLISPRLFLKSLLPIYRSHRKDMSSNLESRLLS